MYILYESTLFNADIPMVNYIHSTVLIVRIVITLAGMVYKEPCVHMQTSQHHANNIVLIGAAGRTASNAHTIVDIQDIL